jgi:hypothetical protein
MSTTIKGELEPLSGPLVLSMPTWASNLFASNAKKSKRLVKTIDIKFFFEGIHSYLLYFRLSLSLLKKVKLLRMSSL